MAHPIFNIPEILRLICKELGSDDLVPLLTVSHRFFISAIPIVWEHVPRSGKLRNLVFPDVDMKKIDGAWLNGIRPLNNESLTRFNLYAPYVKSIHDYPGPGRKDVSWFMLLRAVSVRPLLPNLRFLTILDPGQSVPVAQIIDALLCSTLVNINVPRCRNRIPRPVLSPQRIARIVESCPNIQTLQIFSASTRGHLQLAPASGTLPSDSAVTSVEQLHSLRFVGASPELLSYDVLVLLGNLPSLESLMILIPSNTPEQSIPSQFPRSTGSFPALQHLGIYYKSPSVVSRIWKALPFVQKVTSVWIKIGPDVLADDNNIALRDLLSSICQFSPHVIDFRLDLTSEKRPLSLKLFTLEVMGHLGRLPLQRLRIDTLFAQLGPPEDFEQLAMALHNVEYLDIQESQFTFQGLVCVAKHMPKLRYLAVALYSSNWPSKGELPLTPAPSPSVLCLRSHFTVERGSSEQYESVDNDFVESISIALHRLWPNGVHCEFSHNAIVLLIASRSKQAHMDTIELINSSIKRLCAPGEFDTPRMSSAGEWKYINCDTTLRLSM